jgi:hypothetical protein
MSAQEFKTKEQFIEGCRFASACDLANPASVSDVVIVGFIVPLLGHFRTWCNELGMSPEILTSVQYLLRSQNVRNELAHILFSRGAPSDAQLETTFRLLFLTASTRHSLVASRTTEKLLSDWSAKLLATAMSFLG